MEYFDKVQRINSGKLRITKKLGIQLLEILGQQEKV